MKTFLQTLPLAALCALLIFGPDISDLAKTYNATVEASK
jgi:hypothetical protein